MAHANSENTKQRAMSPKPAAKIAEQALGATADLPEAAFAITASLPARVPRTLKFGDTFIVLDSRGDIRNDPGGTLSGGSAGLFHKDTRHLSRLELLVNGEPPLLLGSTLRDDNSAFFIDLTNPDLMDGQRLILEKDQVHILRTMFVWRDTAHQGLAFTITAITRLHCGFPYCSTTISPICSKCAARIATDAAPPAPNCRATTACCSPIAASTTKCGARHWRSTRRPNG